MSQPTTLKRVKKLLVSGVFAAAVAAVMGFQSTTMSAQSASQLWSIVAHFEYQSGFEFDYVVARGVPSEDLPDYLAYCGRGHQIGSVVRFHCFPVAE